MTKIYKRIHSNHENPSHRSFKLLGIYLDENLNFNANTTALSKNFLEHSSLLTELSTPYLQKH